MVFYRSNTKVLHLSIALPAFWGTLDHPENDAHPLFIAGETFRARLHLNSLQQTGPVVLWAEQE